MPEPMPLTTTESIVIPEKVSTAGAATSLPGPSIVPGEITDWVALRSKVLRQLSEFHQAFAEPVKVIDDDHVRIREYAMIPEKPYVVNYNGEIYEFVRKADGSIAVSEVHIG